MLTVVCCTRTIPFSLLGNCIDSQAPSKYILSHRFVLLCLQSLACEKIENTLYIGLALVMVKYLHCLSKKTKTKEYILALNIY